MEGIQSFFSLAKGFLALRFRHLAKKPTNSHSIVPYSRIEYFFSYERCFITFRQQVLFQDLLAMSPTALPQASLTISILQRFCLESGEMKDDLITFWTRVYFTSSLCWMPTALGPACKQILFLQFPLTCSIALASRNSLSPPY